MSERLVRNAHMRAVAPDRTAPSLAFHRTLPGYAPTPLVEAPRAAAALGAARVLVKDESDRFGLPSFKVLGASYAIHRALGGETVLACATEGNHGRAVAWMARRLGLRARVLVPAAMTEERRAAIAGEGAEVEVVEGTYDDAVQVAAALAGPGTLVVQDTAWPGYEAIPRWIVEGYATIAAEIDAEPDVVAVQIGVGSFASAMVRAYAGARIVGVEPTAAACLQASIEAGEPVDVPGPHDSSMAGLNCGRPSSLAWPVLRDGIEAFASVGDATAAEAVGLLGVEAGPSGAAGLAGLLRFRDELDLAGTTVLVINTAAP